MKIKQNISLDEDLIKAVKILAETNKTNVSNIITNLLNKYIQQKENKKILYRYQLKKWNYDGYIKLISSEIYEKIQKDNFIEASKFLNTDKNIKLAVPLIKLEKLLSMYIDKKNDESVYKDVYDCILQISKEDTYINLNKF